ncbi:hypothetical protein QQG55_20690 [Brugia pahangi]
MLLFVITKHLITLTILTILFSNQIYAQVFTLESFNDNFVGRNSLNNNGNAGFGPAAPPANPANQANQAQQNPFPWQTALGAGLGFLAGTLFNRGSSSPVQYGYYGYPYYPYNYYYRRYPYYYYYYYYYG